MSSPRKTEEGRPPNLKLDDEIQRLQKLRETIQRNQLLLKRVNSPLVERNLIRLTAQERELSTQIGFGDAPS